VGRTVLLVDDQRSVRTVVRQVVEQWDPEALVVEAADGFEALEKVETDRPDLVICDVCMPEMSGFEVLQAVRDHPASWNLPVIMLTGETDQASLAEGYRRRATSYVTKPFNVDDLLEALNYHL
jgi:CheY-like chemotaxis protein